MTTDDIAAALASSHPADLALIRRYVEWIKIRRRVNSRFYFQAHWVTGIRVHWVG